MEKDLKVGVLLDFYGALLTDKQAEALRLYYDGDLSLAEISGLLEITRQGVRDFLKRGEQQLLELEEKLGLFGERQKRLRLAAEIKTQIMAISELNENQYRSASMENSIKNIDMCISELEA